MQGQFFYLEKNGSDQAHPDLIIPDGTPGLMYIHQGAFWRKHRGSAQYFEAGKTFLFGQKTQAVEYRISTAGLKAYGLKLHPASLYALFGIFADELTDSVIELEAVTRSSERIAEWLMNSGEELPLPPRRAIPVRLTVLLTAIHDSQGTIPIQELCRRFQLGYKPIQRLFSRHVGITPKLYARIIRFNHSVRIGAGNAKKLTDVAYQSGYFDQNHFIKEMKRFTGMLPSELLAAPSAFLDQGHLEYLRSRTY